MKTILVAGANRGIGREFVCQLGAAGWIVHATARDDEGCASLAGACKSVHRLDVTHDDEIRALAGSLSGVAFDAILANAGISGDLTRPVDAIDLEEMIRVFDTNISGRCF